MIIGKLFYKDFHDLKFIFITEKYISFKKIHQFFREDFVRIAYDVYLQYLYVGRLYMYEEGCQNENWNYLPHIRYILTYTTKKVF